MMRVFKDLSDWYYANEKLDKAILEDNIVLAKEALSEGAKLHGAYYNVNTFEHTPLCDAAKRGNRAMVELFLDRGADPNRDNRHGTTPLWKASKGGHLDVVRLLLDRGANIFAKSVCASKVFVPEYDFNDGRASMPVGRNSYETALSASSGRVYRLLLDRGAGVHLDLDRAINTKNIARAKESINLIASLPGAVNALGWDGFLYKAAAAGCIEILDILLDKGADPNKLNSDGLTPLWAAASKGCYKGYFEIVKRLLDRGADPNKKNSDGRAPLWAAAVVSPGSPIDVVGLLLDRGADLHAKSTEYGTVLDKANFGVSALLRKRADEQSFVSRVLAMGSSVSQWYSANNTLDSALEANDLDSARQAIRAGAVTERAYGPAARNGRVDIIKRLIEIGAKGKMGALKAAAEHGHIEIARLLIAAMNHREMQSYEGSAAILRAMENGHREIAKLLIAEGAYVNGVDLHAYSLEKGITPLREALGSRNTRIQALDRRDPEIVEALIAAGAKPAAVYRRGKVGFPCDWTLSRNRDNEAQYVWQTGFERQNPVMMFYAMVNGAQVSQGMPLHSPENCTWILNYFISHRQEADDLSRFLNEILVVDLDPHKEFFDKNSYKRLPWGWKEELIISYSNIMMNIYSKINDISSEYELFKYLDALTVTLHPDYVKKSLQQFSPTDKKSLDTFLLSLTYGKVEVAPREWADAPLTMVAGEQALVKHIEEFAAPFGFTKACAKLADKVTAVDGGQDFSRGRR
ncbi:ankyrin repeat domain-containing protein [Rickettsiales bacterium]|nr:ankyrin repeat domain-containing protein [Rickettsiales bacterium]